MNARSQLKLNQVNQNNSSYIKLIILEPIANEWPKVDIELELYDDFKSKVESNKIGECKVLDELTNGQRKNFDGLKTHQKIYFMELAKMLIGRVERDIGRDSFYGNVPGRWNIIIWLQALIILAQVDVPKNEVSCRMKPGVKIGQRTTFEYFYNG